MSQPLYGLYTLLYLPLLVWGVWLYRRNRRIGTLLIVLVSIGTMYDNLILFLGRYIGQGGLLLGLNWLRFASQQALLPLLIVSAVEQARIGGLRWAQDWRWRSGQGVIRNRVLRWAWIGTIATIALGFATRIYGLKLGLAELDGVTRYMAVSSPLPPVSSFITVIVVGVIGAFLWRERGWPWLLLACALEALAEGAVRDAALRGLTGNLTEILFTLALLATDAWLLRRSYHEPDTSPVR
jgi:hypothetical protein